MRGRVDFFTWTWAGSKELKNERHFEVRLKPGLAGAQHAAPLQKQGGGVRLVLGVLVVLGLVFFAVGPAGARAVETGGRGGLGAAGADFAFADFDGDRVPDLASVQAGPDLASRTRYWIRLNFSLGNARSFAVSGPAGGLQIVSRDVNGDSFLDLIISTRLANEPVAVLLNDGAGNFRLADVGEFGAGIWEARLEWAASDFGARGGCAAIVSARLACGDGGDCGFGKSPAVAGKVGFSSEEFLYLVPLRDIRGRAPPVG
jgi:hypothetical protein